MMNPSTAQHEAAWPSFDHNPLPPDRPSSDNKPLNRQARGRVAHGRNAGLGRALLAEREERGPGRCTRERDLNDASEGETRSVMLGLSPMAFTPL
eukprot:358439-Chlamydomonas_euryale.AAC.1